MHLKVLHQTVFGLTVCVPQAEPEILIIITSQSKQGILLRKSRASLTGGLQGTIRYLVYWSRDAPPLPSLSRLPCLAELQARCGNRFQGSLPIDTASQSNKGRGSFETSSRAGHVKSTSFAAFLCNSERG